MCDMGAMQVADGRFYEKGKLGGSAGGSASDSKDKENRVGAQKCTEPETQKRSRCDRCCLATNFSPYFKKLPTMIWS